MKFERFVKSLASTGMIYERGVFKERWLASLSAFMLIPVGIRSVTAVGIADMPKVIDSMIDSLGHTADATLKKAVMPFADGGIKDCVRVYTSVDGTVSIAISNEDYTLIDKSDSTEILYEYDVDNETYTANALLVKKYPDMPDADMELVGMIFPINYDIDI